ncbi:cytochrome P450 oxidoreductase [Apiospora hydei]|uniref:Cytochrome P450 oxidoreductase n=1 Tax=Apiospora hydei TaxID=1337664 RepID=A0ABR1X9L8_9PEZI
MIAYLLSALAITWASLVALDRFLSIPHQLNEPPRILPKVPFIGHIIGMIQHGSNYYEILTKRSGLPIYTIYLPGSKIYVVTSPNLVTAIDRRSKTISFGPYVLSVDLLAEDLLEDDGPVGLRPETLKVMHESLAPGDDLQAITRVMLRRVAEHLEALHCREDAVVAGLFDWTRKFVTRASTDAIYGPSNNPFHKEDVYNALWTIDREFVLLGLNILPNILSPKGARGRRVFFEAMSKYYAAGHHKTASPLVQARHQVESKYGMPQKDMEHFNLSVSYGLLVNTVPSSAWVLYHVYSQPSLLSDVRQTIDSLVRIEGSTDVRVNLPDVIKAYPLLESLVQEVLRLHSTNASGRVVLRDTLIGDKYLLRKDAILLILSKGMHSNTEVWGPTASTFDPTRFLKQRAGRDPHRVPASAYRAWGSGASVCPGRYFATNEILSILIIMVLRYNVSPVRGEWKMPATKSHITTSILTPVTDIDVHIRPRKETSGIQWTFTWETE